MSSFSALFSSVPGGCWITLFSLGTAHLPTQPASSEPPRAAFRCSDRLTTRLRPPPRPAPLRRSARLPTALDPPAERPHTLSRPTAPQHRGYLRLPARRSSSGTSKRERCEENKKHSGAERNGTALLLSVNPPPRGADRMPRGGTARHGSARHGTARHGTGSAGPERQALRPGLPAAGMGFSRAGGAGPAQSCQHGAAGPPPGRRDAAPSGGGHFRHQSGLCEAMLHGRGFTGKKNSWGKGDSSQEEGSSS
ncbi:translation initiation factor IF-2-like [Corvus hawaiiensis]|uniref:translation initiation factor IF-2-like n=1 Tax=Corvus hawaiiensis TaxID=134902 RepID=UPI002019EDC9|nr:translation initiation factor IF-2-like [Corvus hawaiiensis]